MKTSPLQIALIGCLILLIPYILIVGNAYLKIFDESFYKEEFTKNNVYEGVPDADVLLVQVFSFLKGKKPLPDVFNEREHQHMEDVRKLMKIFSTGLFLSIIFLVVITCLLMNNSKFSLKRVVIFFGIGSLLTMGIALLLYYFSDNFLVLFERFHSLFFKEGTWIFSNDDLLIKLFPFQFFYDITYRVMINALISALALLAFSALIYLFYDAYVGKIANQK